MSKVPTLLVPGSLRVDQKISQEIPINYITKWFRQRMSELGNRSIGLNNRILIVRAETGSGKSTILPVEIFRILRNKNTQSAYIYNGPSVLCTQPRVLTTIALTNDISSKAWNSDIKIGDTVGYETGPVSNRPKNGLIYATSGFFAAQLKNQEDMYIMKKYKFIIVDEAHERSLDSDMTIMFLKYFYERNVENENLPFLILTSATFNTKLYANYFNVSESNIVEVIGRSYPIETFWPTNGYNNYIQAAAETALKIHNDHLDDKKHQADILIFMPGISEIKEVIKYLLEYLKKNVDREEQFLILEINREIVISQGDDYQLIFENPDNLPYVNDKKPLRRIIVSTIVAETGLTIDTLKYVIDCGWNRSSEIYQPWRVEGLLTRPAPQSRIKQRKGRVGRLFQGEFYPLYTNKVYDTLDEQQLPDILTVGSLDIHLAIIKEQQKQKIKLKQLPEFRVEDMKMLDPPTTESFMVSNCIAFSLGFVSFNAPLPLTWPPPKITEDFKYKKYGYGLTPLGFLCSSFNYVNMESVRVLLAGYIWNVAASDLITIVSSFGIHFNDLLIGRGRKKGDSSLSSSAKTLKAIIPYFLLSKTGGSLVGILPPDESEKFYFRTKLVLSDDFIETLLLIDSVINILDKSRGNIHAVIDWCKSNGINFEAVLNVIRRRETVIEEMILAGLNPYHLSNMKLINQKIDKFAIQIVSIKKCIYEGLKNMLLTYDENNKEGPCYLTNQNLRVRVPKLFSDENLSRLRALHIVPGASKTIIPKYIITDKIKFVPASFEKDAPFIYKVEANMISVLDGYVSPDLEFTSPRFFSKTTESKTTESKTTESKTTESKTTESKTTESKKIKIYERIKRSITQNKSLMSNLDEVQISALFTHNQYSLFNLSESLRYN